MTATTRPLIELLEKRPWLDATYLKVRQGGRIISVAAIIAVE